MTRRRYRLQKGYFERLYSGIQNYLLVILEFKRSLTKSKFDIAHVTSSASMSLIKDLLLVKIAKRYGVKSVIHFRFGRIPELAEKKQLRMEIIKESCKRC